MAMVRDPAFWRRFSVAVHQDEEAQARATRPELKHSYVTPSPSMQSPTHQIPSPTATMPLSPTSPINPFSPMSSEPPTPSQPNAPRRQPSKLAKSHPSEPRKPRKPAPIYSRRNASALSLGLSGRPTSKFKFWTSIEADPSNRESWLEEQHRKKSKRTFMCWCFWLVFLALVAGIVVAILLLKSKGVI